MPNTSRPLATRLREKSAPDGDCVLWTGGLDAYGYGQMSIGHRGKAKAHRIAWELAYGPIPDGLGVLHKCDTPACINPNHLFLGTQTDNRADCVSKGRHSFGIARRYGLDNPNGKLTDEQRHQIRELSATLTQKELAQRFGVSQSTICRALGRRILEAA